MSYLLNDEELQNRLIYWQKVLGLQDWQIVASIARKGNMDLDCCKGENTWNFVNKESWIHVLDHADWPSTEFEQDMERTLVHELLHLKFALIAPEGKDVNKYQHQLLGDMSKALVYVRRNKSTKNLEGLCR